MFRTAPVVPAIGKSLTKKMKPSIHEAHFTPIIKLLCGPTDKTRLNEAYAYFATRIVQIYFIAAARG
jgi:hypothetical protein